MTTEISDAFGGVPIDKKQWLVVSYTWGFHAVKSFRWEVRRDELITRSYALSRKFE
jgi:hypothetical protein